MTDPGADDTYVGALERWLTDNPGWHTPVEVAVGLGWDTTKAAHNLHYLTRQGRIKRKRNEHKRNGPGSSRFSA